MLKLSWPLLSSTERDDVQSKIWMLMLGGSMKGALECCNLVTVNVLVDVCLHGMLGEYKIFFEKFFFVFF